MTTVTVIGSSPRALTMDSIPLAMKKHSPVFLVNARSLCNKKVLLRSYINEYTTLVVYSVLLSNVVDDAFVNLPSFRLYWAE